MLTLPFRLVQPPVDGAVLISRQGQRKNGWHHGIDLSVVRAGRSTRGAAIRPILPGVVERVCRYPEDCCGGYGSYVLVEHADDLFSFYAHMDRVDVEAGQTVDWTTQLGVVGDQFADFRADNCPRRPIVPHLHLEIRHADGTRYDVLQVLAAGGLRVDEQSSLVRTGPFEYEEPRLAGVVEKSGEPFPYPEVIVGNPTFLRELRPARTLAFGMAAGAILLTVGMLWVATRQQR